MAETEPKSIPSAECDSIDTQTTSKPEQVQLCMFAPNDYNEPAAAIRRTLEYTENPAEYLKKAIGSDEFAKRQSLLCIPEKIDKDVYGNGVHKENFEKHVARLLGKEHGLFYITGVQAQLAALKIYCTAANNNHIAWHVSSHPESAEEEAYKQLYGLKRTLVGADPEENPVEEVMDIVSLSEAQRPAVVFLEIPNRTLGCKTYTFAELERISAACRNANVKLHCDGARLWEIEPYYRETAGKTFKDIGELFDSVYVSFYKGLGGAGGAMLTSNDPAFIKEAKIWQRRAGGNVYTLMYQVLDDERGYNEGIGTFERKWKKMAEVIKSVTEATKEFKNGEGQRIVSFIPEEPTCAQIHTVFEGFTESELLAARDRAFKKTGIRVFERLRSKQTVDEMLKMERDAKASGVSNAAPSTDSKRHFTEWMIIDYTLNYDTQLFVDGYVALCQELTGP